jgi:hypothetical protein
VLLKIDQSDRGRTLYYPLASIHHFVAPNDKGAFWIFPVDSGEEADPLLIKGDHAADLIRQCEALCAQEEVTVRKVKIDEREAQQFGKEVPSEDLAEWLEDFGGLLLQRGYEPPPVVNLCIAAQRLKANPAPPSPSPIEINPDVAALLDRLTDNARDFDDPKDVHSFNPQLADDLRRAVELIRFGRRATGQPDAGNREDDSR